MKIYLIPFSKQNILKRFRAVPQFCFFGTNWRREIWVRKGSTKLDVTLRNIDIMAKRTPGYVLPGRRNMIFIQSFRYPCSSKLLFLIENGLIFRNKSLLIKSICFFRSHLYNTYAFLLMPKNSHFADRRSLNFLLKKANLQWYCQGSLLTL